MLMKPRAGVDNGDYDVAVIIPPDFSASLTPDIDFLNMPESPDAIEITPTTIEIYGNGSAPISSQIASSVTESIAIKS